MKRHLWRRETTLSVSVLHHQKQQSTPFVWLLSSNRSLSDLDRHSCHFGNPLLWSPMISHHCYHKRRQSRSRTGSCRTPWRRPCWSSRWCRYRFDSATPATSCTRSICSRRLRAGQVRSGRGICSRRQETGQVRAWYLKPAPGGRSGQIRAWYL